MKKLIIAVDFDGTIVGHGFPDIGEPIPGSIETLKALKQAGHKLILWTCREDEKKRTYLTEAVDFCKERGVEFDAINETIKEDDFREYGLQRKPYCHYFIDDRNIGGLVPWDEIRKMLL